MQWTEANRELVFTLVSWPVSIVVSQVLIRLDERRLTSSQLERAWPAVTRDMCTMMLGPLCLPLHGLRTRWQPWRIWAESPGVALMKTIAGALWGAFGAIAGYAVLELVLQACDLVLPHS